MGRHVRSFSSTFKSRLANHTESKSEHKQPDIAQEKKKASGSRNMKAYNNAT